MKLRAVLAGMVLMVGSVMYGQDEPMLAPPTPTPTPTPLPTPKPVLKKRPAPTPTPRKKEEPKIEGTTLQRANGGFLGFNFVGNKIVVTFYDDKKRKAPLDVATGVVRWDMKRKIGTDQATLSPGGADTLISARDIPPPHTIRFTLLLFKAGSDKAEETFVVLPGQ